MEKVKEIMEKLGFKDGADDSVKAAFVQNLIFQAYGVRVEIPLKYQSKEKEVRPAPAQLSFNLDNVG